MAKEQLLIKTKTSILEGSNSLHTNVFINKIVEYNYIENVQDIFNNLAYNNKYYLQNTKRYQVKNVW